MDTSENELGIFVSAVWQPMSGELNSSIVTPINTDIWEKELRFIIIFLFLSHNNLLLCPRKRLFVFFILTL
ncbi:hypothetical protein [Picosynechococcus sp. PCC 8807]|uniref:hypothetical protein n=1 Tax=Picosynechococcus sp. PCC 8807 TaxID=195248 RepID=UPI000810767B|nr:hypothetical protein [Picosynechococcus sp. PCC 8807]ANV91739.1 hypothetical protein AWQ24_14535 [Picosynechococcus sp. PCC 8807]